MKVGIIADIHGEINNLQQALALLERHNVDQIICAGDLVDRGPDGASVVSLIRERKIACVQGNHDAQAETTQGFFTRHPEIAAALTTLQPEALHYLKSLPPSLTFEWANQTVYLTHANPWQDAGLYVYPTSPYLRLFDVIAAAKSNIVILGHTHVPMAVSMMDCLIINPGSVYANRNMDARTCGILTLPAGDFALFNIETSQALPLTVKYL